MSLQLVTLDDPKAFKAWRAKQLEKLLDRYPSKDGWFNPNYTYGAGQLMALSVARYCGWPCVLVFDWIGTEQGPYLSLAVVTLDHFPHVSALARELDEARGLIKQIHHITEAK